MVEPEMAYADLDDVIALAEGLVVEVVARVLDKRKAELKVLERDTSKLEAVKAPFPRVTYDEAGEDPASTRACRSSTAATSAAPTRPSCPSSSIARSASRTTPPR